MSNKLNPYVKAVNCTDIADCKHGIDLCNEAIKNTKLGSRTALAYQKRLAKLHAKLQKLAQQEN